MLTKQLLATGALLICSAACRGKLHERVGNDVAATRAEESPPPAEQYEWLLLPVAVDWRCTKPIAATPVHLATGTPTFRPEFAADDFSSYKAAFTSDWIEVSNSYNKLVGLHQPYTSNERQRVPFFQVEASRFLAAEMWALDGSKLFVGGALKPSLPKIQWPRVSPQLRAQIAVQYDTLTMSQNALATARSNVGVQSNRLLQAVNEVGFQTKFIELAEIDHAIATLKVYVALLAGNVDSLKVPPKSQAEDAATVRLLIRGTWPTVSAQIIGVAHPADVEAPIRTTQQLTSLGELIVDLHHRISILAKDEPTRSVSAAVLTVSERVHELQLAISATESAKVIRNNAYRDMSTLIAKAATASGLNAMAQRSVAAAVEVMPKIEAIRDQLQRMNKMLKLPPYTEASGIGAAMAPDTEAFIRSISIVNGARNHIAELTALWDARRSAVWTLINQFNLVDGNG